MRILYLQTFPLYGSGSGTYSRDLAREVAKIHKVAMVVPDKRSVKNVKMYKVDLPVKISFTGHPEWPDSLLYTKVSGQELSSNYLAYFKAIVHAVNEFKPDIIHVHHIMPLTWIARFIKIAYNLNFIVTVHGSELPTIEDDKRYTYLTEEALTRAKRIAANSFWTREWIQKIYGNKFQDQIRVIPGGVNISDFPEDMDTREIDSKYRLGGQKLILFSGKLTKYKGVRYLIQAARNINAVVGVAGDGPEMENLKKMVKKLKLDNVKFFGFIDNHDLIKLYYRADICVVPSVWDEPLGLVVLEAMATKTPVVVTRKGGIPLAVKDGINGVFIRPRNAKEIAEKVNILLADDELRQKIGERARKTILERFTWDKIAHRYERIYQEFRKTADLRDAGPLDKWVNKVLKKPS
ncbi:MAG: glycosyltransferase family 4 protein [Candidatus Levybacteria bacterium]|nr:glycosyltransferase family 4 protein [Candidatus Levybacteria bacterium]